MIAQRISVITISSPSASRPIEPEFVLGAAGYNAAERESVGRVRPRVAAGPCQKRRAVATRAQVSICRLKS